MFKKQVLLNGVDIKDIKCNNKFFRCLIHCPATPRNKFFWNEHFENINWRLIWTYSNKYCINNKVYEIYFKIIHKIYPTNEFLKRYKNDLSELCTFCKKDTETVLHLFFECMFVRFFWIDVEYLFNMLSGVKICIGKRDVFFIMVKKI